MKNSQTLEETSDNKSTLQLIQERLAQKQQQTNDMTQDDCDQFLAYCVAQDEWDVVLDVMDLMQQQGLQQVRSTYTTCLQACQEAANAASALEILTAMQQAGFVPTADDYAVVVATLLRTTTTTPPSKQQRGGFQERLNDALTIVSEHDDLPAETYNQVVASLTTARRWKDSTRLLRFLEDRSTPTLDTYTAVIQCCLGAGNQSEQAVHVLQASLRRNLVPPVATWEAVVQALSSKLQWRRALQVVQLMDDHQVPPTLALYNALLVACSKAREVVTAKHLLVQMRCKHGISPTVRSYNAVLAACASSRRWKDALALLDQLHLQPGLQPDIYTYTNVIRACAKGTLVWFWGLCV